MSDRFVLPGKIAERLDRKLLRQHGLYRSLREYFTGGPMHPWKKRREGV